ncbi:MAG: hypothetical protein C0401_06655 [Anaerolinea sp.]|nr:hypothetical protein [Anaerolinea sp.]
MEPNYLNLDPEERINKMLAAISILLGAASICAGIVPIIGIVGGLLGLFAGIRGRRSESRNIATAGVIVSAFAILISVVYAIFVQIGKANII